MTILKEFTDFLKQGWLPNLLGLTGGLLGLWTFIDSYIIKFKPKIYFGTRVFFDTIKDTKHTRLQAIICSLEFCNHRKKYGVIYDFAIRIYNADEINSKSAVYYATELVDKVPIHIKDLEIQDKRIFNPITVLPNSNQSVNLILSENINGYKMVLTQIGNCYIELYYQKEPDGKWYFIDKMHLYSKDQYNHIEDKYIDLSILKNDSTRKKLDGMLRLQKTNLYTGASQKHLKNKIRHCLYKFIKIPFYRIKDVLVSIPFYSSFLINTIWDKFVKIPIIKKYGIKIEKPNIKIGSPELKPITNIAFAQILNELQNFANQINKNANHEARIIIKQMDNKIILQRYRLSINFYISGDSSIQVNELNAVLNSRLSFSIKLRNGLWNKKYWYLNNYGFISIKSFVVRVLDAFIIHSNY